MAPRARAEELGDVLAEGLYTLLDHPAADIIRTATDPDHWTGVIHERQRMITSLLTQFQDTYGPTDHLIINDVDHCLRTALAVYPATLRDAATLMTSYVETLLDDLDTWYQHTEQFAARARPAENVAQVLDGLRLGARSRRSPTRESAGSRDHAAAGRHDRLHRTGPVIWMRTTIICTIAELPESSYRLPN